MSTRRPSPRATTSGAAIQTGCPLGAGKTTGSRSNCAKTTQGMRAGGWMPDQLSIDLKTLSFDRHARDNNRGRFGRGGELRTRTPRGGDRLGRPARKTETKSPATPITDGAARRKPAISIAFPSAAYTGRHIHPSHQSPQRRRNRLARLRLCRVGVIDRRASRSRIGRRCRQRRGCAPDRSSRAAGSITYSGSGVQLDGVWTTATLASRMRRTSRAMSRPPFSPCWRRPNAKWFPRRDSGTLQALEVSVHKQHNTDARMSRISVTSGCAGQAWLISSNLKGGDPVNCSSSAGSGSGRRSERFLRRTPLSQPAKPVMRKREPVSALVTQMEDGQPA